MAFCVGVCCAYGATSVAITFANKAVLTSYAFHFELSLLLAQLLIGTACLSLLFFSGVCTAPPLSLSNLTKALPLSFWFFLYVITGLGSLRSLTVPTWSAMRRLTSLIILSLDFFLDSKTAPLRIWLSVLVMLLGAVVAAWGDLDGDVRGYTHVTLNCVTSALYLRAVTQCKRATGMSEMGLLLYTNLICLPLVACAMLYFDEARAVLQFGGFTDIAFQASLLSSAVMAGLLNYLVFLSASVNSPLTTCITGQAKNVVGSLGGFILWPSASNASPAHLTGCGVGLCGSVWYAVQKYRERVTATPSKPLAESLSEIAGPGPEKDPGSDKSDKAS